LHGLRLHGLCHLRWLHDLRLRHTRLPWLGLRGGGHRGGGRSRRLLEAGDRGWLGRLRELLHLAVAVR
jgi:hypothetical protein